MINAMSKRQTLTAQLRLAIDAAPLSRYRICKEVGMSPATMSRFMSGKGGLSMEMLDRIAALLDLRIVTGKPKPAKGA